MVLCFCFPSFLNLHLYSSPYNIGLLDPATSDGRVVFFLPWEGSTVVGTTDVLTRVEDNPKPTEEEIQWILGEVAKYLAPNVELRREDVLAAWAGIRPLVKDPNKPNTESLARNHIVYTSPSKLLTVSGGKWTTYRSMALDTVNEAVHVFDVRSFFFHIPFFRFFLALFFDLPFMITV